MSTTMTAKTVPTITDRQHTATLLPLLHRRLYRKTQQARRRHKTTQNNTTTPPPWYSQQKKSRTPRSCQYCTTTKRVSRKMITIIILVVRPYSSSKFHRGLQHTTDTRHTQQTHDIHSRERHFVPAVACLHSVRVRVQDIRDTSS